MGSKKKETRYTISQIADELDISTRTIRFYEEKGLILPGRTTGNQRFYTPRNKARLKLILRGKRFGFTLEEISEMLGMADTDTTESRTSEIEQIEKSLKYGDTKLQEIADRKHELSLLEEDILSTKEKLLKRLKELKSNSEETKTDNI